jgi:hypothetical protein
MSLTMKTAFPGLYDIHTIADDLGYWPAFAPHGVRYLFGNVFGLTQAVGANSVLTQYAMCGIFTCDSDTAATFVSFPASFPNFCQFVVVSHLDDASGGNWSTTRPTLGPCPIQVGVSGQTASGFTVRGGVSIPWDQQVLIDYVGIRGMYIAFGY